MYHHCCLPRHPNEYLLGVSDSQGHEKQEQRAEGHACVGPEEEPRGGKPIVREVLDKHHASAKEVDE